MSRKINVGGNNITFPDKYVKVLNLNKNFTFAPWTDLSGSFADQLSGYDVLGFVIKGYAVTTDWRVQLIIKNCHTNGTFEAYAIPHDGVGNITQTYIIYALAFVKVKAQDAY